MNIASADVQQIFAGIWNSLQKTERDLEAARAKRDPVKYRLSLVMDGHAGYSYYSAGKNGRGSRVRFCYSVNRNVAGYFLVWRETIMDKKTVRDQWDSTTSKRLAARLAVRLAKEHKAKYE